jgi:hypothetical protein
VRDADRQLACALKAKASGFRPSSPFLVGNARSQPSGRLEGRAGAASLSDLQVPSLLNHEQTP